MGYKMLLEDEVLLEKVVNSMVRMNPQLQGISLPETVHGRRRMLAILLYIWGVGEDPKKTMFQNNADLTPFGVALEKALVAERKRRGFTGVNPDTPMFTMNKLRSDYNSYIY